MGEAPTITLGGDPASIRAVADWFRNTLAPSLKRRPELSGTSCVIAWTHGMILLDELSRKGLALD